MRAIRLVWLFSIFTSLSLACGKVAGGESLLPGQWNREQAWAWYHNQPWRVGCNFLPSTAVNDVEMWQKESFDPKTIDRELGWVQEVGFNSVRVFINYIVWESEPDALKANLKEFLAIADRHNLSTLVILLDDCFKPEPQIGHQLDPESGIHNSQWVQSPGVKRRTDQAAWPKLEAYIKDMIGSFALDKRILAWDIYNEPSKETLTLVEACFRWARETSHQQPLTTCVYGGSADPVRLAEISDIISFHEYSGFESTRKVTGEMQSHGRPVLCTEWMARTAGSRCETHLPFFKENKIGCWNWGFVAGRTQTYYPWGSPKGAVEPALWHHDLLRRDGTPFSTNEIHFIKATITGIPAKP